MCLCVCVCVCVCVGVCKYIYIYKYIYIHFIYTCSHTHTRTHSHTHTHMHTYTHTNTLTQIDAYKALFEVYEEVILEIKPGVAMRKIYELVSSKLKERDPKFVASLFKELGWALGYEVRDKR